ncbi:MAG: T9SS type A sorting domain-containing protein [Bacteroidetes bacterium]|nr:T9SS C-terminal target domain-containing protein [Bacteroidota bacterium]NOG56723.1 T9SS type A sorting domain-containing protein [Bacteroidota bacterium]
MKKLVLIVILTIAYLPQQVNAQTYFPEGATWTYHEPSFMSNSFSYTTIEAMGDSIFNGDTLSYLKGTVTCSVGKNELLKQIGDQVYKLNKCDSSYTLLYDFGASVGDTLTIYTDVCQFNDTIYLHVDSIVSSNINGRVLDRFYLSQLNFNGYSFGGEVIEGIGNTVSFYPLMGFCDPVGGPLRCYSDTVMGEYKTGIYGGVCDTVLVGVNELLLPNYSIFPNPTSGKINIDFGEVQSKLNAIVRNSLGQIVSRHEVISAQNLEINIEATSGLYFLQLIKPNGELKTIKILKE